MAEAQAPTAFTSTPDIRILLSNCEYLALRAFGRHGNMVVYHIISGNQNTLEQSKPVVCIMEVVEGTQEVQVKINDNGPVVIKAVYGKGPLQDMMLLFHPHGHAPFAEIHSMGAIDHNNPNNKLIFSYSQNFPVGRCTVRSGIGHGNVNAFVAYIDDYYQCTYLKVAVSGVSIMQKVILMMAMLKLHYSVYLLHLTVKPAGILGRMPPIPKFLPSLQYLTHMSHILMRAACRTPSARIIEVLESTTNHIVLIIEIEIKSAANKFNIFFRDPFGTLCFRREVSNDISRLYTHTGTMFGSYSRMAGTCITNFFDIQHWSAVMIEKSKGGSLSNHFQIKTADPNATVVAEVTPLVEDVLLSVTMSRAIPAEHKALILAETSNKANRYYELFKSPVADINSYSYRPSS